MHDWDAFLSHASEDKEAIAVPLVDALRARGFRVWLDTLEMTVGDSLSRSIDAGLARSRFGIVILSPSFFAKEWPQRELDGLVAREVGGEKVILPVWHTIDREGVLAISPTLANRVAAKSMDGIEAVAGALERAITKGNKRVDPRAGVVPLPQQQHRRNGERIHHQRVEQVLAGGIPVDLISQSLLVMHIIPDEALTGRTTQRFEAISRSPDHFLPIGCRLQQYFLIQREGLLVGSNINGLDVPQRAYSFVFRNGVVECVASSLLRGRQENVLGLPGLQNMIVNQTLRVTKSLTTLGMTAPHHVHVTLAGVGGARLLQEWPEGAFAEDMPFGVLDEGPLYFDAATLTGVPIDRENCYQMLRPVLLHLANAANLPAPPPIT